jgi:glycosyltransferase involved in cell wall biosynthesis
VDVENPTKMVEKIFNLLTNKTLYESVALAGYTNSVNRFSSKKVVKEYLDYYEDILITY